MAATREGTVQRPSVAIRPFAPEDYGALTELYNLVDPEYPGTELEVREEDAQWDRDRFVQARYVAVDPETGALLGSAEYNHMPWSYDPRRFSVWIGVRPDRQGRGIGRALYEQVRTDLRARGANALRSWAREDRAESIAFLGHRDFQELERAWESRLDMGAFDPKEFGHRTRVRAGIEIVTLAAELERDPDSMRRVYELIDVISPDTPRLDPYTSPGFEAWRRHLQGPWFLPEAFFLAKDGDEYVGESDLGKSEAEPDVAYTGFTGVRREYRGRGVAWALKLRALTWAKQHKYREVRTWNSTRNAPMLGINVALGFRKQPVWITFAKDLTEES
ncbi:MAG TPA: GNAT family N-acetyltransferase [Thermoplasmata archaeon]|jgi:GNAT superfamily N-acetyltransferase|nr:GNAT family N-acetyltransferase [Thermoplasmata archaeon]